MQTGSISVQTENIFPIIKKFLYSDQEIFLRELISNAVDATSKLRTLSNRGEVTGELGDTHIEILIDNEAKTLTIRDRGIGMTEEEVMKYLNQVAFSSATEFLEKYKEGSIIGHFGLGFYSAFMVANQVDVITKSYKDAPAVKWTCDGNPAYTLEAADRDFRGTDIVLHVEDESKEYLEEGRIQELLTKYCKFLPVEIKFKDEAINNTSPAWKKQPSELTDEDYIAFYQELYPHSDQPLFWIHLNIDFPFNLTGVLYFPKLTNNLEVSKNNIQLYSNQVYVTDNVKEIVPEFLMLLHGVIDSPDIPLNVSRSYLQSDRNVKKITSYITKKVADKLHDLFKKDREAFEGKWNDIGTFIKYGMITETKFDEKATKYVLLKNLKNEYSTVEEYKEKVKATQTDKNGKIVLLYSNNPIEHHSYIESATNAGYDVLEFDVVLDNHFMQHLETKNSDITFTRVDSNTIDKLVDKDEKRESVLSDDVQDELKVWFTKRAEVDKATVEMVALSPDEMPVVITKPEFMRRMQEMSRMQGNNAFGNFPETFNLIVNTNHTLINEKLLNLESEEEKVELVDYLYNLARLNQNMLKGQDLASFVKKSINFLG
ncbi:MAG: molecular chaperone HtpG [Saprospiraceae bacterium]